MADFLNQPLADDSGSEDDDFNPAPAVESDNDDVGDESDVDGQPVKSEAPQRKVNEDAYDDDDGEPPVKRRAAQNANEDEDANGDEDEDAHGEEDEEGDGEDLGEDDDEEDEEDEEEVQGHRRKRAKRDARLQFIDVEAEVDDEEEEDEAEDDELPDETHPDDLLDTAGAENDDRRHRELDRQRELAASMDAEKQAQALKEKYGRSRGAAADSVVVPQRLLLPSVNDPRIYGVKCKPGKEREVIFSITKRIESKKDSKDPYKIVSAFERGGTSMAGYIYVEAWSKDDVYAVLDNSLYVYPRTKCELIDIKEMPDLLRVQKTKMLEPGMYVRIKKGLYAGDLAQVNEVETNGLQVEVRIVPRLDYGANEDLQSTQHQAGGEKRKRAPGFMTSAATVNRPPQRLFSESEARKKTSRLLQPVSSLSGKTFQYMGDTYVDGFLVKELKIQHLETENVEPTLEEVSKFAAGDNDGTENLDLSALQATLKSKTAAANYLPGDNVEIFQGEQAGIKGKAKTVNGDIVALEVDEGQMKGQTVEAPARILRKRFREGDHVKVIGGSKYQDEVGMVVRIKEDRVTFLSDATNAEVTVFSKDLREAADTGGKVATAKYGITDLVQLDSATVGLVAKIDRETIRVLDQNNNMRTLLPSQIVDTIDTRKKPVATDRDGSEIQVGDLVKEFGGEQKHGEVFHIYRNYIFCAARAHRENMGYFVLRPQNCSVFATATGSKNRGMDLSKMNPELMKNKPPGASMMPPPRPRGPDRLMGKTVSIRRGAYKGLLGRVVDTTDDHARIELMSRKAPLSLPKDYLVVKDPVTGQTIDIGKSTPRRPGPADAGPRYGGHTPMRTPGFNGSSSGGWSGSRTPMGGAASGGRTPAWTGGGDGGRTPGWGGNSGGRTPAWSMSGGGGSRTPGGWGGNDGSRTAYGDGSRTAYGDGGRTAYGGWSGGSRTPATSHGSSGGSYDAGNRTPAWSGGASAPTPSASGYSGSRTPAYQPNSHSSSSLAPPSHGSASNSSNPWATHSAPTPGATTAPTPGAAGAPTPYDAPTPGGFNAPTPGGAMDHPTPRYPGGSGGGHGLGGGGHGLGGGGGAYGTPAASGGGAAAAPTPGGFAAETPGGFAAETPAGFADDDE
ncbi:hypothetical protein BDY21DRAFT_292226 [Lineolata rhizophorae]|uniref:Transcription elongation factor SPT5 n=1 Tax=Lineolata rhizophorae TaxID=578093 RepID=A0A6A6NQS9_9PEZI|nr:hypothetical protein BDY21DRAFT_292226 [Lineolata rhizophorae]